MAAPVYIPTLCRHEHFKRCIESLANCSLADQTDVYVALDYPLTDEHRIGWEKINNLLNLLKIKSPFKKLFVIKRESNLGAFMNDIKTLEEYIIPYYDRWIFTEDDNEFSPNFLEYINYCLNHFQDDKKTLAVCGYNWPNYQIKTDGNNWYRQDVFFSAWGFGIWRDRWIECHRKIRNKKYFKKHLYNPKSLWHTWRTGTHNTQLFLNYSMTDQYLYHIYDELWAAYMHLENKYLIMPTLSKVINHGFDGSGLHCDRLTPDTNPILDKERHFSLQGNDIYFQQNRQAIVNGNYGIQKVPKWIFQRFIGTWENPFLDEWNTPYLIKVGNELL